MSTTNSQVKTYIWPVFHFYKLYVQSIKPYNRVRTCIYCEWMLIAPLASITCYSSCVVNRGGTRDFCVFLDKHTYVICSTHRPTRTYTKLNTILCSAPYFAVRISVRRLTWNHIFMLLVGKAHINSVVSSSSSISCNRGSFNMLLYSTCVKAELFCSVLRTYIAHIVPKLAMRICTLTVYIYMRIV